MEKNKQVAKKENTGVPAYLQTDEDLGVDSIGKEDIVIPRLKLVQLTTKIKNTTSLKDGDFYHSVINEKIESPLVYILLHWKSTTFFTPDQKFYGSAYINPKTQQVELVGGDEFIAKYNSDDAALFESGIDGQNYMIVLKDQVDNAVKTGSVPEILIYTASSAAIKYARQLNGKIKFNASKKIPIYAQQIQINSVKQSFGKGDAFMPDFSYPNYADEKSIVLLKAMHLEAKKLQGKTESHVDVTEVEDSGNDKTEPAPF